MAIKDKAVKDDILKTFLTEVSEFRACMNLIKEQRLPETFTIPAPTDKGLEEMQQFIEKHVVETFTSTKPSKLTEYETKSDLIEVWSTLKLVDSLRAGTATKIEFLGL